MGRRERVFFEDSSFETIVFDHPQRVEAHDKGFENGDKHFEFFRVDFGNAQYFRFCESFLSAYKQVQHFFELLLVTEYIATPEL